MRIFNHRKCTSMLDRALSSRPCTLQTMTSAQYRAIFRRAITSRSPLYGHECSLILKLLLLYGHWIPDLFTTIIQRQCTVANLTVQHINSVPSLPNPPSAPIHDQISSSDQILPSMQLIPRIRSSRSRGRLQSSQTATKWYYYHHMKICNCNNSLSGVNINEIN